MPRESVWCASQGAFTPDANEALCAIYLHVKSMQRRIDNPAALFARICERTFRALAYQNALSARADEVFKIIVSCLMCDG